MQMNNVSHVKFGGFDEVGALNNLTGNPNFTFIKTESNGSWKLNMEKVNVFGQDHQISFAQNPRYTVFEMAYSYIYMPLDDFKGIAQVIQTVFGE